MDTRDPAIARNSAGGHSAYLQGEYALAADLYRQALARAQSIGDGREICAADISIAICMTEADDDAPCFVHRFR